MCVHWWGCFTREGKTGQREGTQCTVTPRGNTRAWSPGGVQGCLRQVCHLGRLPWEFSNDRTLNSITVLVFPWYSVWSEQSHLDQEAVFFSRHRKGWRASPDIVPRCHQPLLMVQPERIVLMPNSGREGQQRVCFRSCEPREQKRVSSIS